MLNHLIKFHKTSSVDLLVKILIASAAISLLGPISIELEGGIDLTLQTLVILLFAIAFGWRVGLFSVLLYFAVAALGAPILAGYESLADKELRSVGGFYFSFLAAAVACGFLAEMPRARQLLPSLGIWTIGHVIILGMGFAQYWSFNPPERPWHEEIMEYVPAAMIKVGLGLLIIKLTERVVLRGAK